MSRDKGAADPDGSVARRTLLHYVATCHECDVIPKGPRSATVHAMAKKHRVTESRHYVVEVPE